MSTLGAGHTQHHPHAPLASLVEAERYRFRMSDLDLPLILAD